MDALLSLLDEDQREYNNLADRILENSALTREEELRFYDLHFRVPIKKYHATSALVKSYRDRKEWNNRLILSEQERKYMFRVLEEKRLLKRGLNRWEYKYLCFVKSLYNIETEAEAPALPEVTKISFQDFTNRCATNPHRKKLVGILVKGLQRCAEVFGLEDVAFLAGGSFIDDKENPGDIDLALILPPKAFSSDYKQDKMNQIILEFQELDENDEPKKRLDINKLPEGFDHQIYMGYDILTLLGNTPENDAEEGLHNNHFQPRNIYRIKCRVSELK